MHSVCRNNFSLFGQLEFSTCGGDDFTFTTVDFYVTVCCMSSLLDCQSNVVWCVKEMVVRRSYCEMTRVHCQYIANIPSTVFGELLTSCHSFLQHYPFVVTSQCIRRVYKRLSCRWHTRFTQAFCGFSTGKHSV